VVKLLYSTQFCGTKNWQTLHHHDGIIPINTHCLAICIAYSRHFPVLNFPVYKLCLKTPSPLFIFSITQRKNEPIIIIVAVRNPAQICFHETTGRPLPKVRAAASGPSLKPPLKRWTHVLTLTLTVHAFVIHVWMLFLWIEQFICRYDNFGLGAGTKLGAAPRFQPNTTTHHVSLKRTQCVVSV